MHFLFCHSNDEIIEQIEGLDLIKYQMKKNSEEVWLTVVDSSTHQKLRNKGLAIRADNDEIAQYITTLESTEISPEGTTCSNTNRNNGET